jgi:hypothetical protein
MNGVSTDLMALACIMGSAVVGGVVTVAALDRGPEVDAVCVSGAVHETPAVIVGLGEPGRTLVVAPRVRMRATRGCEAVVIDVDREARVHFDEVRVEMERARVRSEEARIRIEEALGREVEARLHQEMQRLEQELSRLEGEVVR